MDLARNAEISQKFMLSGREDSETKKGDPSLQKWSPYPKSKIKNWKSANAPYPFSTLLIVSFNTVAL